MESRNRVQMKGTEGHLMCSIHRKASPNDSNDTQEMRERAVLIYKENAEAGKGGI